jgi:hypothetical protein
VCSLLLCSRADSARYSPLRPAPPKPQVQQAPPLATTQTATNETAAIDIQQVSADSEPSVHRDIWGSTPLAAASEPWGTTTGSIGEGWAETVLASGESADQFGRSVDSSTAQQQQAAGAAEASVDRAGTAQTTVPEQQDDAASAKKDKDKLLGPPGLTRRAGQRNRQDAAVVMPNERALGVERVGVQFGSLALFDNNAAAGGETTGQQEQAREPELKHRLACLGTCRLFTLY